MGFWIYDPVTGEKLEWVPEPEDNQTTTPTPAPTTPINTTSGSNKRRVYFPDGSYDFFTQEEINAMTEAEMDFRFDPYPTQPETPAPTTGGTQSNPKGLTRTPQYDIELPQPKYDEDGNFIGYENVKQAVYQGEDGVLVYYDPIQGTWVNVPGSTGTKSKTVVPPMPTTTLPKGYYWAYDPNSETWVPKYGADPDIENKVLSRTYTDSEGNIWNVYTDGTTSNKPVGYDPTKDTRVGKQKTADQTEQDRLQIERDRLALEQKTAEQNAADAKAQRLADLKANPASWLQYSAEAGENPVVQPWMMPLAPAGYQGTVGSELPGWSDSESSASKLDELLTPATQYYARMSPSMRGQYRGYEKARTGQTEEDVDWRLWSRAPGAGQATRLNYTS